MSFLAVAWPGQPQASRYGDLPELAWHTYGSGHLHGLSAPGLGLELALEPDALHRETQRRLSSAEQPQPLILKRGYTALGQLNHLSLRGPGSAKGEQHYRYDALGRRISKTVHHASGTTATTHYGWDGDRLVHEAKERHQTTVVYEPGSFVPMLRIEQAGDGAAKQISAFVTDALGTPMQLVTPRGDILWQAQPDDWAAVTNEQGRTAQPIRFQGQWYDEESGLYYNRHRYYDPQQGRYISQDPIGLNGGTNLYGYVSNPTGMVDPLGLEAIAGNCNTNNGLLGQVSNKASDIWGGVKWRYNAVATGLSEDFSDGFLEGMVRFTGGRPEQSFFEQTVDNYSSSSLAMGLIGDPIKKGAGIVTGGAMARTYGGYTAGSYLFRGPAPHLGTHSGTLRLVAGTTATNSALVTASYEGGAATGSLIRTSLNRFFRIFAQ